MRVLLAKMWQRTRPSFDMSLQAKQLIIDYTNVTEVQLRYCTPLFVVSYMRFVVWDLVKSIFFLPLRIAFLTLHRHHGPRAALLYAAILRHRA